MALLHCLKTQAQEYGYALCAVHCEHGIRGEESRADMAFVKELCAEWQIPLFTFSDDCVERAKRERLSLETAARAFRYESFASLVQEGKADFIALAHHQGDEAETVLFRLARGASLTGMSAMKAENGIFLRPILDWKKSDILTYVQWNRLAYREDFTNFELDATRNKIRLRVLPELEKAVAGATENIARFAERAAEDDGLLYALSEKLLTEEVDGIAVAFSAQKPLFTRACLTAIKRLGLCKDYTATHLNGLFALQASERGARLQLPENICAERRKDSLYFFVEREEAFPRAAGKKFSLEGFDGGRYEVNISSALPATPLNEWKILRFDGEKMPKSAVFRFRREGDELRRFDGVTKSLKKLFNEKEIPVKERGWLPIIGEEERTVYAVCGVEISEQIKVDENTKNTLYITIRRKEK